jgi:hypothetical protein
LYFFIKTEAEVSVLVELPHIVIAASSEIVDGCDLVCCCWLIGWLIGSCLMTEKMPQTAAVQFQRVLSVV